MLGIAAEETLEGDQGGTTSSEFDDPRGNGVLSVRGVVHAADATTAERAAGNAKGIEDQFRDTTTVVGLDGVWKRNDDVMRVLQDHFPNLYADLVEIYETSKAAMEGPDQ